MPALLYSCRIAVPFESRPRVCQRGGSPNPQVYCGSLLKITQSAGVRGTASSILSVLAAACRFVLDRQIHICGFGWSAPGKRADLPQVGAGEHSFGSGISDTALLYDEVLIRTIGHRIQVRHPDLRKGRRWQLAASGYTEDERGVQPG